MGSISTDQPGIGLTLANRDIQRKPRVGAAQDGADRSSGGWVQTAREETRTLGHEMTRWLDERFRTSIWSFISVTNEM